MSRFENFAAISRQARPHAAPIPADSDLKDLRYTFESQLKQKEGGLTDPNIIKKRFEKVMKSYVLGVGQGGTVYSL